MCDGACRCHTYPRTTLWSQFSLCTIVSLPGIVWVPPSLTLSGSSGEHFSQESPFQPLRIGILDLISYYQFLPSRDLEHCSRSFSPSQCLNLISHQVIFISPANTFTWLLECRLILPGLVCYGLSHVHFWLLLCPSKFSLLPFPPHSSLDWPWAFLILLGLQACTVTPGLNAVFPLNNSTFKWWWFYRDAPPS